MTSSSSIKRKHVLSADDMNKLASKNLDDMREIAARICRDYLTGAWRTISSDDIQLKRISGGLSNFLYHVSLPGSIDNNNEKSIVPNTVKRMRKDSLNNALPEPKEVLLRIYGQTHGEQALETVLTDTVVFTLLSERKLGPKLHGIFPGGRIEQYIPARPLSTNELCDSRISSKIAEKMAAIHSLNIPVSKEPEWLWKTMDRWLINCESVLATFESTNAAELKFAEEMRAVDFRAEVAWLKATIEAEDFAVVFSHNDMQEGNILFREGISSPSGSMERMSSFFEESVALDSHFENIIISPDRSTIENGNPNDIAGARQTINTRSRKRSFSLNHDDCDLDSTRDSVLSGNSQCDNCDPELMIIDFEYCAYNYRGFDVANHFVEWTFDYTNPTFPFFYQKKAQYPTKEQQERFITAYLTTVAAADMPEDYVPAVGDVVEMLDEVRCFTMASHLFWTLWCIVNVRQEIEFGYWDYGSARVKEYFAAKEEFNKFKGLRLKRTHTLDERH